MSEDTSGGQPQANKQRPPPGSLGTDEAAQKRSCQEDTKCCAVGVVMPLERAGQGRQELCKQGEHSPREHSPRAKVRHSFAEPRPGKIAEGMAAQEHETIRSLSPLRFSAGSSEDLSHLRTVRVTKRRGVEHQQDLVQAVQEGQQQRRGVAPHRPLSIADRTSPPKTRFARASRTTCAQCCASSAAARNPCSVSR